jgi:DNA-binding GntR family transcriptional regulator
MESPKAVTVDDVVSTIETDIIFGKYFPRERLVEEDLIIKTMAKRHTVRAALKELEARGLVIREKNRGASVRQLSDTEIDHIYQMRALLQAAAVDMMTFPLPEGFAGEIRRLHSEYEKAIEQGDILEVNNLNEAFHRKIFSACENPNLIADVEGYGNIVKAMRSHAIAVPERLEKSRLEHEKMVRAIEDNDRETLRDLCVSHLWGALDAYRFHMSLRGKS